MRRRLKRLTSQGSISTIKKEVVAAVMVMLMARVVTVMVMAMAMATTITDILQQLSRRHLTKSIPPLVGRVTWNN